MLSIQLIKPNYLVPQFLLKLHLSLSDLLHSKKEKHKQILKNILGALEWEKRQLFNNGSYNFSNIVVRTRLLYIGLNASYD